MVPPHNQKMMEYTDWIEREARVINSDGCTMASEFRHECCYRHDLQYHYHRCARSAFSLYLLGFTHPWKEAAPVSRYETDKQFFSCLCNKSSFGPFSPVAWLRFLAVRLFGFIAWRKSFAGNSDTSR